MAAVDSHTAWAVGHGVLLVGSLRVLLSLVFFKGVATWWYKASYTGALASYAIVCLKSLGPPNTQQPVAYLQKALMDENVQYFVLALYWWISKPISLTLLPFATFSLFHVLTFVRTNILPKFAPAAVKPATPASTAGSVPKPPQGAVDKAGRAIQLWVKGNYDGAMRFTAVVELVILARVVIGALTFQNSLLTPVFFAHFLRLRYYHSAFTRGAVDAASARADNFVKGQSPPVQKGYAVVKDVIRRWAGSVLQKRDAAPAPTAAAGGAVPAARR